MKTYLDLLKKLISFKSVSTDPAFKPGIVKTVNWLEKLLKANGFKVETASGFDNPIILASYIHNPSLKTCLIYGHYDVQPAFKEEGWFQDPFKLLVGEDRLYARGAVDNKGQITVHLASVFALIKEKKLGYNIKFLIEGNEETGSGKMEQYVDKYKKKLKADFALISDGELTQGLPVIELGYRGGFNTTLTIRTAGSDLHSGVFGGAAPSSAHVLVSLLAKLFNDDSRVTLPGFYDDVDELPKHQPETVINFDFDEYKRVTGAKAVLLADGEDYFLKTGLQPTVQITGIKSGFSGGGYRNAIPAESTVKINFRLVRSQDPKAVFSSLRKFIEVNVPDYADFVLELSDPYEGVKLKIDNEYVKKTVKVLEEAYSTKTVFKYVGGGLPIVTYFSEKLKIPVVSTPFANEDCNMHAVNENFLKSDLQKALKFSRIFLTKQPGHGKN